MRSESLRIKQGSEHYPLYVGSGLLEELSRVGEEVKPGCRQAIVIAPRVDALYGDRVRASFRSDTPLFPFDDGEEKKTLAQVSELLDRMVQARLRRDTLLFLVGGGVVGDAAGFAASILLRGVAFIHVPTTLLSQVDSSIGGKLGVNHPDGKNLFGTITAPAAVVSDVSVLRTLDRGDVLSGTFEAMKSGVIGDPALFEMLEHETVSMDDLQRVQEIVIRAVSVKGAIVSSDERELGSRRLLNYGHTVGHAIETAAHYRGISHGEAVGWGMIGANALARRRGIVSATEARRIDDAIRIKKPVTLSELSREALLVAAGFDKKFSDKKRVMVLPAAIGRCVVAEDISPEELELAVDATLEAMRGSK